MARKYREVTYQEAVGIGFMGWIIRIILFIIVLAIIGAML